MASADHETERMGEDFYEPVFSLAIEQTRQGDTTYGAIRDSIRKEWRPTS
jgi:hypothetical protein